MKHNHTILLHIFTALALSLVINFSYLLVPIITDQGVNDAPMDSQNMEHNTGVLRLSRDMHGYIICDCSLRDSTYVTAWQVRTMKLQDGDTLEFTAREPRGVPSEIAGAHQRLDHVLMRNGEKFDLDMIYDRPSRTVEFVWQILYYALLSFILISIFVMGKRVGESMAARYVRMIILAVLVTGVAIYFAPVMAFKDGVMRIVFFFDGPRHDNLYLVVLTKSLFMLVVSALYSYIYSLMQQREKIVVENERLKTENLAARYNMLMGQINPHFFFNSLNSLSMLVREQDNDRALEYIDQLSYTFRYIAEAYAYLFKIRYEDKLFFDIDIAEEYMSWTLPALSLQPLIGNAVKHNTITSKNPMRVVIRVVDGVLEVENKKSQKLDTEPSTGIGLKNLRSRWQIVASRDIEVIDEAERFLVRLPLQR